jgi:hypothetical protein
VVTPAPALNRGALSYHQAILPGSGAPEWPFPTHPTSTVDQGEEATTASPAVLDPFAALIAPPSPAEAVTMTPVMEGAETGDTFDWEAACADPSSVTARSAIAELLPAPGVVAPAGPPAPLVSRHSDGGGDVRPRATTGPMDIATTGSVASRLAPAPKTLPISLLTPAELPDQRSVLLSPTTGVIQPLRPPEAPTPEVSPVFGAMSSRPAPLAVGTPMPLETPPALVSVAARVSETPEPLGSLSAATTPLSVPEGTSSLAPATPAPIPLQAEGSQPWDLFQRPAAKESIPDDLAVQRSITPESVPSLRSRKKLFLALAAPVVVGLGIAAVKVWGPSSQAENVSTPILAAVQARASAPAKGPERTTYAPSIMSASVNVAQSPQAVVVKTPTNQEQRENLAQYTAARDALEKLLAAPNDAARTPFLLSGEAASAGPLPAGPWEATSVSFIGMSQSEGDVFANRTTFDAQIQPGPRTIRFIFRHTPDGPKVQRELLVGQFTDVVQAYAKEPKSEPKKFYAQVSQRHSFEATDPDLDRFLCLQIRPASGEGAAIRAFVDKATPQGDKIGKMIGWGRSQCALIELAPHPARPDIGIPHGFLSVKELHHLE